MSLPIISSNKTQYRSQVEERIKKLKDALQKSTEKRNSTDNKIIAAFEPLFTKVGGHHFRQKVELELEKGLTENWDKVVAKIHRSALKAYPFFQNHDSIGFCTGTQSSTVIGMKQWSRKNGLPRPALVPTGRLLAHQVVPLTGELGMGIASSGINRKYLSGTTLEGFGTAYRYALPLTVHHYVMEREWTRVQSFKLAEYDSLRLEIACLRLIHFATDPEIVKRAKEHIAEKILPSTQQLPLLWLLRFRLLVNPYSIKLYADTTSSEEELANIAIGTLVLFVTNSRLKTGMILARNPDSKEYSILYYEGSFQSCLRRHKEVTLFNGDYDPFVLDYPSISPELLASVKEFFPLTYRPEPLQAILALFDTEKKVELSDEERVLLQDPFPIVWAAHQEFNDAQVTSSYYQIERAAGKELQVGTDLTYLFTKERRIPQMRQWLLHQECSSVKVMSFSSGLFISAMHLPS